MLYPASPDANDIATTGATAVKFERIVLLCNVCWTDTSGDVETPAEYTLIYRTSDDSDEWYRLDVCENHAENGTSLINLMEAAERINPAAPPTRRAVGRPGKAATVEMTGFMYSCPTCGKAITTKSGVSLHMRAMHPDEWAQFVIERDAAKADEKKARSQ